VTAQLRVSCALSLLGAALGGLGLTGWFLDASLMTNFIGGRPAMMPNTGLMLVMAGLAGAISPVAARNARVRAIVANILALIVFAMAVATILEYAFGVSLGLDQALTRVEVPAPYPGRPSPLTAVALMLPASALLAPERWTPRGAHAGEWLVLGAAFLAFVSIVAHLHGADQVSEERSAPAIGVAVPSALGLLLIAAGLLFRPANGGSMAVVTSRRPGGVIVRRLGIVAIFGPPILGVLTHRVFIMEGVEDVSLMLALLTSASVPIALTFIVVTGRTLDRVHAALEQSREQARVLIEESADGFFVADLDGRYTFVNAAGCQMLGRSREEIVGKTIIDLIPATEVPRLAESKVHLLNGETHTADWHLKRKDGTYLPVEVSAKILADGRWQGLVRDITRRKAAEAAARRYEARLEGIISIAADAIVSIDKDQRIAMYNKGAERVFGWSHDEVIGRAIDVLIPERFVEAHRAHVRGFGPQNVVARMSIDRSTVVGLRKNGEEFPAEAAISRLDVEGEPLYTVILRDVTEPTRLRKELHEALDRLQAATRLKDEMLNIVAHDLRAPLSNALLSAGLLVREVPEARREASLKAVEGIRRGIRRATRLVDDLLDVARIESGRLELLLDSVSPKTLVFDAVDSFLPLADQVSVQLDWNVAEGLSPVRADRDRIQQVFGNLLDNAIKFTKPGGRVLVTAAREANTVRFAVSDSGRGIDAEHLPRVFDRFWQVSQGEHRGSGLGLTIAKGFVEAHGGEIRVESTVDVGSTFSFTLPIDARTTRISTPEAT
jgi:PAS domain S-box-containing protein